MKDRQPYRATITIDVKVNATSSADADHQLGKGLNYIRGIFNVTKSKAELWVNLDEARM